jgi:hypothetical protein
MLNAERGTFDGNRSLFGGAISLNILESKAAHLGFSRTYETPVPPSFHHRRRSCGIGLGDIRPGANVFANAEGAGPRHTRDCA